MGNDPGRYEYEVIYVGKDRKEKGVIAVLTPPGYQGIRKWIARVKRKQAVAQILSALKISKNRMGSEHCFRAPVFLSQGLFLEEEMSYLGAVWKV